MNNDAPISPSPSVVRPLTTKNKMPVLVGVGIAVVLVGIGVGYFASSKKTVANKVGNNTAVVQVSQNEAGVADVSGLKDATGTLKEGGLNGEGTYHLERPGGDTQTVYLTSTVINLSPFVGKKVQVWGETQASKNAAWFMDVGKIKVVE